MEVTAKRTVRTQPYEFAEMELTLSIDDVPDDYFKPFQPANRLMMYARERLADWESVVREENE